MSHFNTESFVQLQEYASLVLEYGPLRQQSTTLHYLKTSQGQHARLFRAVVSKDFVKESALLKEFADEFPDGLRDAKYQSVRAQLKSDLLQLVLTLDLKRGKLSEYAQRRYALDKAEAQAKILAVRDRRRLAVSLALGYIEEAKVLEEWSSAEEFALILKYNASLEGNLKDYEKYAALAERYRELRTFELNAIEAIERIELVFARSTGEKPHLVGVVEHAREALKPALEAHNTFKLRSLDLRLRLLGLGLSMNYRKALSVCDEGDALMQGYPLFANRNRREHYAFERVHCYVQLSYNKKAKEAIQVCEDMLDPNSNNWYYFKEWHALYFARVGAWKEALAICKTVDESARMAMQPDALKQRFQLMRLWVDFWIGKSLPGERPEKNEKAGAITAKLLQIVPTLKDDRTGFKMSMISLEVLILLLRRNRREDLIARIESLAVYRSRYLRDSEMRQHGLFIKLLQLLVSCDFQKSRVNEQAAPILRDLDLNIKERGIMGRQIIPYPLLWKEIDAAL